MWQRLQLHKIPACGQRLEENAPRGKLFYCNDVIKEIYFCTKLSLSPFLKCKCNHVTSCLEFISGSQSFTTVVSKSWVFFFPAPEPFIKQNIHPLGGHMKFLLDLTGSATQPRSPVAKAAVKSLQSWTGQPPPPAHSVTQTQGGALPSETP